MGGMGGRAGWDRVGWVEGGKNYRLGHPMSSHDVHTVANKTIVGHIVSGSKPKSPLPNWHCHCSSCDFRGLAKFP